MNPTERYTQRQIVSAVQSALDGLFESSADVPRDVWLRLPHRDARQALIQLDNTVLCAAILIEQAASRREPLSDSERALLRRCAGAIGKIRDTVEAATVPERQEMAPPSMGRVSVR